MILLEIRRTQRVMRPSPLKNSQMTILCSRRASNGSPRTRRILRPSPLKNTKVTIRSNRRASIGSPRARRVLSPSPLKNTQMTSKYRKPKRMEGPENEPTGPLLCDHHLQLQHMYLNPIKQEEPELVMILEQLRGTQTRRYYLDIAQSY
jgi:hypothetical protein